MKIDKTKLKKASSEVPADCRVIIERIKAVSQESLLQELQALKASTFVKCELFHWSDVLDIFDEVLERGCKKEKDTSWILACDRPENGELKTLLLQVLSFTSMLIEHSFSRHLYNSMEHLTSLLTSCDMTVVLEVLNLLYVFSKRSNFITRLSNEKKQGLIIQLTHLAESWGGKDNGFGLAECCQDATISEFPSSATTLHFEFYHENPEEKSARKGSANIVTSIHVENVDKIGKIPSQIMEDIVSAYELQKMPQKKQTLLYTHIRLAHLFSRYETRIQCVQARLQSIAILVYSNAIQDNINSLLYPGFIEELVDIVELKTNEIVDIKSAALRTLTSIIHLERNPKLSNIVDATGAASYHGFLPTLVRNCIQHMTDADMKAFPLSYATALFSFLYHLASYESGVEALVSCGMMESLLKVINWFGVGHDHITFATRAVRVVDLITNLDMVTFQTQGGLQSFINRLEHEVSICRAEQPFEIRPPRSDSILDSQPESPPLAMETDTPHDDHVSEDTPTHTDSSPESASGAGATAMEVNPDRPSTSTGIMHDPDLPPLPDYSAAKTGRQCFPQRAALLKSMLNFLKKAIPEPAFSDSMRHLMDGSLPKSLKHIISNAEYYGPSLFLLATDVVTVYVFQEPSLLSSLQDNGLTDVVLHALLIKDVPATREVLASLPNVFSALCLNARGLESFVKCQPFERLFKVLLSPDYLPAMRRRRSADPFGDTASNLGNAMDDLMRHQPSLRIAATKGIIRLLQEVNQMGSDKQYVCQKPAPKADQLLSVRSPQVQDGGSSDEEEEEEEMTGASAAGGVAGVVSAESQEGAGTKPLQSESSQSGATAQSSGPDKHAIPLMDYVLNVMKFVEAILSNNSTDDHCREFVGQNGLPELMEILGLPNLPIEFPASPACQAVASVCKAILTLLRDPKVLEEGLKKLNTVLESLEPLHQPLDPPGGSVLLRELAIVAHIPDATLSPSATPLLHALSSAHAYITMFVHVCKMGQTDMRNISVSHWGSPLGQKVLSGLSKLYTSLVWESTVLLALCSEDKLPSDTDFGRADMNKLLPKDFKVESESKEEDLLSRASVSPGSNGVSQAMESLSTSDAPINMETDDTTPGEKEGKKTKLSPALQAQVKQLKPLMTVSSRLGRALAELFGLLVKLSVGGRLRQRGNQMPPTMPIVPNPSAQSLAKWLCKLLTDGIKWEPPQYSPHPRLRLTFLVCSLGFTSVMLFDDKKQPYHLMLQNFMECDGQTALFDVFNWALSINGSVALNEGLEDPALPLGTGSFLDAWLMLIEKMVNPKTVLESTHLLPAKATGTFLKPFDPIQYLIGAQKAAFMAVMNLWNKKPLKVFGGRMSESILAILCHIFKAETIIQEHLSKQKKDESNGATAGPSSAAAGASGVGAAGSSSSGTLVGASTARPVNEGYVTALMEMGFTRASCIDALNHTQTLEEATEYLLTNFDPTAAEPPFSMPEIAGVDLDEDEQMMQAIALSLKPEAKAEEEAKKKEAEKAAAETEQKREDSQEPLSKATLDNFTSNLFPGCLALLDMLPETVYRVCELLIVVTQRNGQEWQNMALNTLVDEETMMPCAEAVENSDLTELLVQVMMAGKEYLLAVKNAPTPKWLAPLLLLLDLYEKVSVISRRKLDAEVSMNNCHTWKWFDDSNGRWCKYTAGNNKTIDDAYQAGESSIRFTAGRRRYTVHFSSMVQINEDTGNRRPIMLTPLSTMEIKQSNEKKEENTSEAQAVSDSKVDKMDTDSGALTEDKAAVKVVTGLTSAQISNIISSVVSMISVPVEAETLHAALRLILRLTREHKYALQFAELGGPRLLLGLTQASAFQGFLSLVTLIFRHILEEPASLRYCMEKVVKNSCSGAGSSISGVSQRSFGAKEMNYVLRVLSPAACRDPHLFAEIGKECMRIALPPPSKRDEEESRLTGPNAPQILRCIATKQMSSAGGSGEGKMSQSLSEVLEQVVTELTDRQSEITRQNSTAEMLHTEDDQVNAEGSSDGANKGTDGKSGEDKQIQKPLLTKSNILRILSEIIKSYCNCTQLVTQHMYHAKQSELLEEDCSVLAFVLDHLLHASGNMGDKDCPALSRVFIASIASCNHCPEAQLTLVSEVKSALQRALGLPESSDKHTRVQALVGIINTMIESCPTPGQVPNQVFKGQQTLMNNMVKNLLKRGLVTDLARIPYSLDLSSPFMAATVNAGLKPLETLSRSVNQHSQGGVTAKQKKTTADVQESAENNTTTPNAPESQEAQQPDGNEVSIEEVLNPSQSEDQPVDDQDVLVDVDIEEGDLDDHHDSQMISQLISETDDDDIDHTQSSNQHVLFNALDNGGNIRTYQVPISLHDNDNNGNDAADHRLMNLFCSTAPSVPPPPSNVSMIHPLLVRQSDPQGVASRLQRGRGRGGMCRYNPGTQTLHVNFPRPPNPPVILQRLLGPSTTADILQLTNSLSTQAGPAHTRVVLANSNLSISRPDEENILEELYQETFPDASSGVGPSTLSNIPNTLNRWTEEAKVLDGDSVHDCMAERREKRRKAAEEEAAKKAAEEAKKREQSTGEQNMEVSVCTTSATSTLGTDVSNIPLPGETTAQTTSTPATLNASEAASVAEALTERIFDNISGMSSPLTSSSVTSSAPPVETTMGSFQAMPPLTSSAQPQAPLPMQTPVGAALGLGSRPPLPPPPSIGFTPDIIPMYPGGPALPQSLVSSSPLIGPPPTTLQFTPGPLPPAVNQIFAPPTLPVPPPPSFPTDLTASSSPATLGSSNVTSSSSTPAGQVPIFPPLSMSTPFPVLPTPAPTQGINLREIFESYMSTNFPLTPLTNTTQSSDQPSSRPSSTTPGLAMSNLASLLVGGDNDQSGPSPVITSSSGFGRLGGRARTSALTTSSLGPTLPPRVEAESGMITPEDISNITSSDGATVHSSRSESPQEVDRALVNLGPASGVNPAPSADSSSAEGVATSAAPPVASSSSLASSEQGASGSAPSVPEGLDPSFLAALPENIRAEVIADHLRMQRIQQRTREQQQNTPPGGMEVNAEFLAALPPNIQEEVLAQQRIEQERITAAQNPTTTNPEAPVDPASFFATLPSSLRQSVLADMDDTMMAVLPADLAAEAQGLRRELEDRHRRIMQDRLFTQPGSSGSLSSILRHAGTIRCTLSRNQRAGQGFSFGNRDREFLPALKLRGRHLLDHEALTCLLVLLFVDEPKLNTGRLHRVLRNLCYHGPTRAWVLQAMMSILNRTADTRVDVEDKTKTPSSDKGKGKKSQSQTPMQTEGPLGSRIEARSQGSWLSISLEAALGCRANVFQIQRAPGKKHTSSANAMVTIHAQAAPIVCRHVLDALISLARMFPNHFLPSKAKEVQKCDSKDKETDAKSKTSTSATGATPKVKSIEKTDSKTESRETDFWELLVKLDSLCSSKKGKGIQRTHSTLSNEHEPGFRDFDTSPIGQLMVMLSHPVIKRSQLLTDRLLRLLGLVSRGLCDNGPSVIGTTGLSRAQEVTPAIVRRVENTASSLSQAAAQATEPEKEEEEAPILERQLATAVEVLTSKACSEEGLEDATTLLLQVSMANRATRSSVLDMLLGGARQVGLSVCQHIRLLFEELVSLREKQTGLEPDLSEEGRDQDVVQSGQGKGVLQDKYTGHSVIVMAPKKLKTGRELQLASMSKLTSKSSSQHFFLRIIKVIIQLREAARSANKVKKVSGASAAAAGTATITHSPGASSRHLRDIGEAMALLEAEADAIMQFVTRRRDGSNHAPPAVEINIQDAGEDGNDADTPHVPPPVHGAVGLGAEEEGAGAAEQEGEAPMETDKPGTSGESEPPKETNEVQLPRLSEQLGLEELWVHLGECLTELDKTPDHHAVLILQPAVEAFFLVHAGEKEGKGKESGPAKREDQLAHLNVDMPASPQPSGSAVDRPGLNRENSMQTSITASLPPDAQKFLRFAETHRTVLNQILRQSTTPLTDGPFSVLVDHTRILDFDVKRRYFRQELDRMDRGMRREDLAVHVRREHVFEDSFRELFRRSADEWKHRFYIVFEGEDGQDAGGLLREWYIIIAREIFNPMYALFTISPGDRVTYTINTLSHCNSNHLSYFKFVGRIIAKAIYDNKLMECYFTRSFYKHIIGQAVKHTDMESEDHSFYKSLVFLLENNVKDLGYELTFSTEIQEFGVNQIRDLIPDGQNILVTEQTKYDYVKYVCQMKMTGAIRQQLNAFMEGFYDIIPKKLISIFNEQELELLICGLPTIDIDDLKSNTEYHKYQQTSLQIQWFWRALRSFDQADRARFLQFVTGTSKVPLQGFAHLEGMNGTQKFQIHRDDRSTDRLPAAHTCFNQLDLPAYETNSIEIRVRKPDICVQFKGV
ncbi:HUWE1-like protein [Mya arenaria]|uniref:HECT-type E3 ubiquitin transferase n=1 Tax=Mya arenaria TaxID=6604 RepID=A0ABY7G1B4_MYAAR|nr:HUWE1-like protein [Mya arenaria]